MTSLPDVRAQRSLAGPSLRSRLSALAIALAFAVVSCSSDGQDSSETDASDVATTTSASDDTVDDSVVIAEPTTTQDPSTTEAATTSEAPTTTEGGSEATEPDDPYLVDTTVGPVQGAASAVDGVRNFLAIPYAEAPIGGLAWSAPVPRAESSEPIDATQPGASCPQSTEGITTSFVITPDPDPDCLTLSVWSPDDADGLPVMFWIHGGGLTTGSAHEPYYTGDDLASEGVVVVNVNYRLGAFGFLALEELRTDDGAVGNYGFLDQQLGLQWVADNIEAFGGDPSQVTIFGESAGGASVCAHLGAPASDGLYSKAIVQSGGGCERGQQPEAAFETGQALLAAVGCDDVACLRSTPDVDIIAANDDVGVGGFVIDGTTLPTTGAERAAAGDLDDVAVLIGSNADESMLFTLGLEEPTDDELLGLADTLIPGAGADLVAAYPAGDFETNLARFQAMSTDVRFTCSTLRYAALVPDAFVYNFTFVSESNPFGLGATHGAELAYLFAHPEGLNVESQSTDRTMEMSDLIQAAWAEFATTGDPGESFDPFADGQTVTILNLPFEQVDEIRDGRCAIVDELIG